MIGAYLIIPLLLVMTAAGLAGAVVLVRRVFLIITVTGRSMEPTYRTGDRVLVRRCRRYRRGAVAVFRAAQVFGSAPGGDSDRLVMKRIMAVPGDQVPADVRAAVGATPGELVPPGHLVVLGDGPVSRDSRHWGYLPVAALTGLVVADLRGMGQA